MKKKRLIAVLSSMVIVITLFGGCAMKKESAAGSEGKKSKTKIGMVTDKAGLGDKSFNDLAYEGLKKVEKDSGVKITVLESKQEENYEPNLKKLAKDSDLTFATGFLMKDAVTKISKDMGEKNFAIIDAIVDSSNVKSITFKEEEGSFLMGIIAGKMTKTNKVGFIGGIDGPIIQKFEAGYTAGVKAVNPAAAEGLVGRKTIKYTGSFSNSDKGYELAKVLYDDGCDVIYHASGAAGTGLLKAAKESKKWAIGVDKDQSITAPEYKDVILSSMIKRVDTAVYEASKEVLEGKFKGGKDNVLVLGLKGDGVGMASTTKNNTPKEVISLADKYKSAIINGKFKVPAKIEEVKEFTVPSI